MPCGTELAPVLACNEVTDRLYGTIGDGVLEICEFDCVGDTVVRYAPVTDNLTTVGLVCDSVRNRLYYLCLYNDGGYLYGLDCVTLDVISEDCTGIDPASLQADPARYRMMCLCKGAWWRLDAATLSVFDYKGDSLYATGAVLLSRWEHVMCHNPVTGRLYYWWGPGVGGAGVIDEQTNRVVAQAFLPGASLYELAYSRISNKLYFLHGSRLGVMDGAGDSLLKDIEIFVRWFGYPCWYPDGNKVYCSAYAGAHWYIAVVDCYTDSVVRGIDIYDDVDGFEYLGEGRMLCVRYQGLTLIDCRTDSVLADSATEVSTEYSAAHTGDGKKVYVTRYGRLQVRSSSTLSLLATIDWPYGGLHGCGWLVYSDTTHKLYWFSDNADSVLAIDATSDTVVARMATSAGYGRTCLDRTGRYLFCASPYDSCLRVYDTQSDSLVVVYPQLPFPPLAVTPNPDQGCIYVGCQDVILVYPDVPPGVCEQPGTPIPPELPPQTVVRNILYLPEAAGSKPRAVSLLDATGRKVMDLEPGANDISRVAPGVYFVRENQPQAQAQAVQKVIVAR
jgi:DNA-binding beta-propeller fold protein YncE